MTGISMLRRVKTRLGLSLDATKDELLLELLASAKDAAKAFTGRDELPQGAETAVVCLAILAYNRLGMEGETSRSEGGVSVGVDAMPEDVRSLLRPFRVARTVM